MYLIMDTCCIIPDYWMTSRKLRTIIDNARTLDITIVFPEVVVDELVTNYRRELEESKSKHDKFCDLIRSQKPTKQDYIQKKTFEYECELREKMVSPITLYDTPYVAGETIYSRIRDHKKPFSDSESGLKDFFIWLSVLDILENYDSKVVFISKNTKDFADESDKDKLHPDLLADVLSLPRGESDISFYTSIESFLDQYCKPKQEQLDSIRNSMLIGKIHDINMELWVLRNEADLVELCAIDESLLADGKDGESCQIKRIKKPRSFRLVHASAWEEDYEYVVIEFVADVVISYSYDLKLESGNKVVVSDSNEEEAYLDVRAFVRRDSDSLEVVETIGVRKRSATSD